MSSWNFSYYIADPPISADGFLPAHRLAFQHSRRLWPRPCRLHVPQVSFCHLHVPKLFYYHFPYYNHIAPGKLLLVALMCQKQTSVIPIRKKDIKIASTTISYPSSRRTVTYNLVKTYRSFTSPIPEPGPDPRINFFSHQFAFITVVFSLSSLIMYTSQK